MANNPQRNSISKPEAADRLGVSERTIDRLRADGELLAMKRGSKAQSRVKIDVASLEAYEERQREAARPRPAWADIDTRFPIPQLNKARAAKAARHTKGETQ